MAPVQACEVPVERVAYATGYLLRHVQRYQGAVRAMISASIVRPDSAGMRPGYRFGLIDEALAPLDGSLGLRRPESLQQLKQRLAIVVSAEALFSLTDLCGLPPEDAIATAVHAARALTASALTEDEQSS